MYHVLLADDEPIILSGLQSMLDWEQLDCTVCGAARNGRQAMEIVAARRPDIVICDINMPLCTGLELLESCARQYPEVVFIMLTNHQDFHMAQQSLRGRAVDYLLKIDQMKISILATAVFSGQELTQLRVQLDRLKREYAISPQPFLCYAQSMGKGDYVSAAKRYVDAHILERVSVQDAAAAIGITPNYLSSLFKRQLGQNFMDYVNATKVKYACTLLRDGKHMVYEVSHMLGYDNAYYFTKVFKRYMKMTPTEYQAESARG